MVATGRLREHPKGSLKIERMAVKKEHRGKNIGQGLLEYMIKNAKYKKPKRIWMQSQVKAKNFYEKNNFKVVSEEYDLYNLGIPHVDMEYRGKV